MSAVTAQNARERARGGARAPWLATTGLRLATGLLLAPASCDRAAPAQPSATPAPAPSAPGTILLVDDLPLAAGELTQLCADISALYPEYARIHVQCLALTNEFLPRLAVRAAQPEAWARARAACEAAGERIESFTSVPFEGGFHALGLALWSAARHLEPGRWSEPLELTGRWARVRLDGRDERPDPREEVLRISLIEFPVLVPEQAHEAIEAAIDRAHLWLVDPAFAEAVPETWKHRMHAAKP